MAAVAGVEGKGREGKERKGKGRAADESLSKSLRPHTIYNKFKHVCPSDRFKLILFALWVFGDRGEKLHTKKI